MVKTIIICILLLSCSLASPSCKDNSKVFEKRGNYGTVSCEVFCAEAKWGKVGKCVKGINTLTNEIVACDKAVGLIYPKGTLNCFCQE